MSVQTEINRINTAVNSQTTLLDQALALIEGKAAGGGGGGSVELCTVSMSVNAGTFYYTTLENGVIAHKSVTKTASYSTFSISVVKNSIVAMSFTNYPQSTTVNSAVDPLANLVNTPNAMYLALVKGDGATITYYTASGGGGEK